MGQKKVIGIGIMHKYEHWEERVTEDQPPKSLPTCKNDVCKKYLFQAYVLLIMNQRIKAAE